MGVRDLAANASPRLRPQLPERGTTAVRRVRSLGVGTERQILTTRLNRRLSTGYGDKAIQRP